MLPRVMSINMLACIKPQIFEHSEIKKTKTKTHPTGAFNVQLFTFTRVFDHFPLIYDHGKEL